MVLATCRNRQNTKMMMEKGRNPYLMQLFITVKAMIKINWLRTTSVEKTEVLLRPKS